VSERLRAWRLLVKILFAPETPAETDELRKAVAAPDTSWLDIIEHANVDSVTATLWDTLERRSLASGLGEDVAEYLGSFHDLNRTRNAAIGSQITACLGQLAGAGIPAIPIKGAAYLLASLDRDTLSRQTSDIDLLVRQEAVLTAREVLIGVGYRETENAPRDGPEHHHLTALAHEDLPAAVELHTAVVPHSLEAALPTRAIWDNARRYRANGSDYLLPSATDTATISFVHYELIDLGTELWRIPLREFHDLHVLHRALGAAISWPEVAARASAVRAATRFKRYLHVYEQLSGNALLPELRYSIADSASYRVYLSAIAWPEIMRWRLRADRLSERLLRRHFRLKGGALEVNAYRAKRILQMLAKAVSRVGAASRRDS
jgi:hypothetical protein